MRIEPIEVDGEWATVNIHHIEAINAGIEALKKTLDLRVNLTEFEIAALDAIAVMAIEKRPIPEHWRDYIHALPAVSKKLRATLEALADARLNEATTT